MVNSAFSVFKIKKKSVSGMTKAKETIVELIEAKAKKFTDAADEIWATPETRFAVKESVKPFYRVLEEEGFSIEKGVANMEHAFVATYGSGKPVIGILAEYDALANLSQVADLGEQKALVEGENGQGCGHNLLGTGALAGAVGIKDYLAQSDLEGTIQLFGCPAEESGYGKAFMDAGGESANVVQPSARLYYFIRAPKIEQAKEIYDRVNKVAQGAALMTETELEMTFDSACYNYIPNQSVTTAMYENLQAFGLLGLTEEDQSYAQCYYDTLSAPVKLSLTQRAKAFAPGIDEAEA